MIAAHTLWFEVTFTKYVYISQHVDDNVTSGCCDISPQVNLRKGETEERQAGGRVGEPRTVLCARTALTRRALGVTAR